MMFFYSLSLTLINSINALFWMYNWLIPNYSNTINQLTLPIFLLFIFSFYKFDDFFFFWSSLNWCKQKKKLLNKWWVSRQTKRAKELGKESKSIKYWGDNNFSLSLKIIRMNWMKVRRYLMRVNLLNKQASNQSNESNSNNK